MNNNIRIFIFLPILFLISTPYASATSLFPDPNISISPISGHAPLFVEFTANNTASLTSFTWNFGDGNIYTTKDMSQVNTSHIYSQPGTYKTPENFSFIYNGDDFGIGYGGTIITVYPTANFSASPTSGIAPLNVSFTDTSVLTI